jgi:hypothetical protein
MTLTLSASACLSSFNHYFSVLPYRSIFNPPPPFSAINFAKRKIPKNFAATDNPESNKKTNIYSLEKYSYTYFKFLFVNVAAVGTS